MDINNRTLLAAAIVPQVRYRITYTRSRPNNSQMTYNFTIMAWLQESWNYIRNGHALMCGITIAGVQRTVRIKANTNDNWEGTAARFRHLSITVPSVVGNAQQFLRFQVWSDGQFPINCRNDRQQYGFLSPYRSIVGTQCHSTDKPLRKSDISGRKCHTFMERRGGWYK